MITTTLILLLIVKLKRMNLIKIPGLFAAGTMKRNSENFEVRKNECTGGERKLSS